MVIANPAIYLFMYLNGRAALSRSLLIYFSSSSCSVLFYSLCDSIPFYFLNCYCIKVSNRRSFLFFFNCVDIIFYVMNPSPPLGGWEVHKFGGTSVGNAACFRRVADIVNGVIDRRRVDGVRNKICVVVSAMGKAEQGDTKTTDMLLELLQAAQDAKSDVVAAVTKKLYEKHANCLDDLFAKEKVECERISNKICQDLKDVGDILKAVTLLRSAHARTAGVVAGYGELWSATILASVLGKVGGLKTKFVDARSIVVVQEDAAPGRMREAHINWEASFENMAQLLGDCDPDLDAIVVTGFIAADAKGVPTTLGRNGSDHSATIFARLLRASSAVIWTDVDGVLSADPRRVPDARVLSDLSYDEAMELAFFGANVLHPKTFLPLMAENIPVYIRNTFKPAERGTKIFNRNSDHVAATRKNCAHGFSTIDGMALLNLEGAGMIGVPGICMRLFAALQNECISVTMVSQASSEHSICVAVKMSDVDAAVAAAKEAFRSELLRGQVSSVEYIAPVTIIAAVGDTMQFTPGVSGRFFGAMSNVNILAIAQGSSERNISAVVRQEDSTRALRAVHAAFNPPAGGCPSPTSQIQQLRDELLRLQRENEALKRQLVANAGEAPTTF